MPEYLRVTDKDTGHKRTITKSQLAHGNYTVLKQEAVDRYGDPLPPEFTAVEPTGHKADTPKEK